MTDADGEELVADQLQGYRRQVKLFELQVQDLQCDLREERSLVEKLRVELQDQGRELLEARTVAVRAAQQRERAEWALLGVHVLGTAKG